MELSKSRQALQLAQELVFATRYAVRYLAERQLAFHPSLKPQVLMRQLVRAVLPLEEGVILDPFMGSGSTVAAAEALGLRCVGVDVDAEYFALARRAVPALAAFSPRGEKRVG